MVPRYTPYSTQNKLKRSHQYIHHPFFEQRQIKVKMAPDDQTTDLAALTNLADLLSAAASNISSLARNNITEALSNNHCNATKPSLHTGTEHAHQGLSPGSVVAIAVFVIFLVSIFCASSFLLGRRFGKNEVVSKLHEMPAQELLIEVERLYHESRKGLYRRRPYGYTSKYKRVEYTDNNALLERTVTIVENLDRTGAGSAPDLTRMRATAASRAELQDAQRRGEHFPDF